MLARVQHIWFQKSPLRECGGNRQESTFMCHQRDRKSTQGGRSVQQPASKRHLQSLGTSGGAGRKKGFLGTTAARFVTGVQRDTRSRSPTRTLLDQTPLRECLNWVSLFLECPDFCTERGELWRWLQPRAGLQNWITTSLRCLEPEKGNCSLVGCRWLAEHQDSLVHSESTVGYKQHFPRCHPLQDLKKTLFLFPDSIKDRFESSSTLSRLRRSHPPKAEADGLAKILSCHLQEGNRGCKLMTKVPFSSAF